MSPWCPERLSVKKAADHRHVGRSVFLLNRRGATNGSRICGWDGCLAGGLAIVGGVLLDELGWGTGVSLGGG